MIYLRTGANGTFKTVFTLEDVRKLQLETGRPVCVNARFKMLPAKLAEFEWKVIEFKDWEAQDDGTIFLIDECHNDMPVRQNGSAVPPQIAKMAEHRARGFDFFLLTQHPMNIDSFIRKIIGSPGYHQHHKRILGGSDLVRVRQWDAVRSDCEKDGSQGSAEVKTRTPNKDVYTWFESATLHTAKWRIPKAVWVFLICAFVVPGLFYAGFKFITPKKTTPQALEAQKNSTAPTLAGAAKDSRAPAMTTAEYLASFAPRVTDLQHTSPRYDQVTQPTQAPYPAACVLMGSKCKCYTTQATALPTPDALCREIVKGGFYIDWQAPPAPAQATPAHAAPLASS